MRTPSHITSTEYSDSLKEFLECRCLLLGNTLLCRECGASIVHARVVVSSMTQRSMTSRRRAGREHGL
jgi:hypothetical protein